eukprot:scaffold867_cov317-Pavlova_lutheri.AAC.56
MQAAASPARTSRGVRSTRGDDGACCDGCWLLTLSSFVVGIGHQCVRAGVVEEGTFGSGGGFPRMDHPICDSCIRIRRPVSVWCIERQDCGAVGPVPHGTRPLRRLLAADGDLARGSVCRASARVTGRSHPWVLSLRNTSSHTGHVRSHASGPHPNVSLRPGPPSPRKSPPSSPFKSPRSTPRPPGPNPPLVSGSIGRDAPPGSPPHPIRLKLKPVSANHQFPASTGAACCATPSGRLARNKAWTRWNALHPNGKDRGASKANGKDRPWTWTWTWTKGVDETTGKTKTNANDGGSRTQERCEWNERVGRRTN